MWRRRFPSSASEKSDSSVHSNPPILGKCMRYIVNPFQDDGHLLLRHTGDPRHEWLGGCGAFPQVFRFRFQFFSSRILIVTSAGVLARDSGCLVFFMSKEVALQTHHWGACVYIVLDLLEHLTRTSPKQPSSRSSSPAMRTPTLSTRNGWWSWNLWAAGTHW
jgi:hypothetical protein